MCLSILIRKFADEQRVGRHAVVRAPQNVFRHAPNPAQTHSRCMPTMPSKSKRDCSPQTRRKITPLCLPQSWLNGAFVDVLGCGWSFFLVNSLSFNGSVGSAPHPAVRRFRHFVKKNVQRGKARETRKRTTGGTQQEIIFFFTAVTTREQQHAHCTASQALPSPSRANLCRT